MPEMHHYFNYNSKENESIEEIAKRFRCDISAIEKKDGLFKIPARYGACPRGRFYVISRGETLPAIAKKFDISFHALMEANPYLNPNSYVWGQTIIIPADSPSEMIDARQYEFGKKENLYDILRRFNMSITQLRRLNPGVDLFNLKPGDLLYIKEPIDTAGENPHCFYYTIQAGENLSVLCQKFGVSAIELLKANQNLRPLEFTPNQRVFVPYK